MAQPHSSSISLLIELELDPVTHLRLSRERTIGHIAANHAAELCVLLGEERDRSKYAFIIILREDPCQNIVRSVCFHDNLAVGVVMGQYDNRSESRSQRIVARLLSSTERRTT
jgi:hypothetical protein